MVPFQEALHAQKRCSAVEAQKMLRARYKYLPSDAQFEDWIKKKIKAYRQQQIPFGINDSGTPDKIAVVVHVIHNGEPYGQGLNISDEQIYSQIEVLNEDYRKLNADTVNTQPEFKNMAGMLNVEFMLARQTETGDPTTGIVRAKGPKSSYNITVSDRELLSSVSHWNPDMYLNIWVTDLTSPYIGLAQFPDYTLPGIDSEPNRGNVATDGMVIDYKAFGSEQKVPGLNLQNNYNLGRTTTHEMAHFFGLKHPWGDVTGVGGCSVDDYVADTPNSSNDYSGDCVPADHVSCGTNDMFENFLYYTNDACMNIFTKEQVARMLIILNNAPRRFSLLNSAGTEYPQNNYVDLAIQSIDQPGMVACTEEVTPQLTIKNNGTIPIANFRLTFTVDQLSGEYIYAGDTLQAGQAKTIQLEAMTLAPQAYLLSAELDSIAGDVNGENNRMSHAFAVDKQSDFIPLRQEFEQISLDMTNWITINEDQQIGWALETAPDISSDNRAAYMNMYNYDKMQQKDWLISPELDLADLAEASVTFRTSYARHLDFQDRLKVVVSTDCGNSFTDILANYSSDDLANENAETYWEPSGQQDWTDRSLDLGSYIGEKNVRVAFLAINGFGNNLFLDNIEFFPTAKDKLVKSARNSFTLYPNPSNDGMVQLAFNTSKRQRVFVTIINEMGQIITTNSYENTLNQTYYYDLTGLQSGVYFIKAIGEDFVRSKKLVIRR